MPVPGLPLTDHEIFPIINIILPAWILLLVGPKWKLTSGLCYLAAFVLSVLYTLLIYKKATDPQGLNFSLMFSLDGIIELFQDPEAVFLGWVHYCVADLWVGRWIALDAKTRRVPMLLTAPILVLAMMLGPMGLMVYLPLRTFFKEPKMDFKLC